MAAARLAALAARRAGPGAAPRRAKVQPCLPTRRRHFAGAALSARVLVPSLLTSPDEVRSEVARFAALPPTPVTLQEILASLEPSQLAKFLHKEVPVRIAERLRRIEEEIPEWETIADVALVHESLLKTFVALRQVDCEPDLEKFSRVVREAIWEQRHAVVTMAKGLAELRRRHGDDRYGAAFADRFLDGFLLNRIGGNVLMSQYLACLGEDTPAGAGGLLTGIVDPACDPAKICKEVAEEVQNVCEENTGLRPLVRVEAYSAVGVDLNSPRFPYIPSFLKYIIAELLKNSCKATSEAAAATAPKSALAPKAELSRRPIAIIVCADEERIAIRVSDRARGIPFSVGGRIWSYLYSTADRGPTELAGYGVGLPLSRLYARYLGGSLDLVSMPGYGTDAYLMLPRLQDAQMEVVPDSDHQYTTMSLSDFSL